MVKIFFCRIKAAADSFSSRHFWVKDVCLCTDILKLEVPPWQTYWHHDDDDDDDYNDNNDDDDDDYDNDDTDDNDDNANVANIVSDNEDVDYDDDELSKG